MGTWTMRSIKILAFSSIVIDSVAGCTIIAVGQIAGGGSTFLAHTDDSGGGTQDTRLVRVPAADWPQGSVRNIYATEYPYPRLVVDDRGPGYTSFEEANETMSKPVGSIPQVDHTYAYWDTDYGVMNEKSLSMAESTCGSRTAGWSVTDSPPNADPPGQCMWGIDELTRVALERCDSARCAIELMGRLAEENGYYSNDAGTREAPLYDDSAECLGISDQFGEVWMFHVMTGINAKSAIWVAKRLKDTDVTVIANGMTIRDVTVSDKDHYLISKNAIQDAKDQGWYVPGKEEGSDIDFTATFGPVLDYSKGLPISVLYVGRRVWRVLSLYAPSLNLDPRLGSIPQHETYPFSVTAEKGVNVTHVFSTLRDYFQETEFDLSKGPFSGAFHSPARYDIPMDQRNLLGQGGFERSIATYRTTFSFVAVTRPSLPCEIGGLFWYGQDAPWGTTYIPIYGFQNEIHSSYMIGHMAQYNPNSAYWIFNFLNNWAQLRFNVIQPEIEKIAHRLEMETLKEQYQVENKVLSKYQSKYEIINNNQNVENVNEEEEDEDIETILKELENWSLSKMTNMISEWKSLTVMLIGKYHNGWQTNFEGDNSGQPLPYGPGPAIQCLGYDPEWLTEVGFTKWPGDTYVSIEVDDDDDELLEGVVGSNNDNRYVIFDYFFISGFAVGLTIMMHQAWFNGKGICNMVRRCKDHAAGYSTIKEETPKSIQIEMTSENVPRYTRTVV